MAILDVRGFSTIVGNIAAAVQGNANAILDYSIGSVLRAIAEAETGVALWLQSLILKVLLVTRAATSTSTDLDSWVGDFGVTRLGQSNSVGYVSFSRFTTTVVGFVPVGAQVRTTDLSQTFTVTADPTNAAYSATLAGYSIAIGVAAVICPVVAVVPGAAANVAAGAVTVLASSVSGIDVVGNTVGFTGGSEAESDVSLRARFISFIASLSKATVGALTYAIQSLQLGSMVVIVENIDYNGSTDNGMVTVIVDDGSGHASSTFVQNCQTAINLVRAAGVRVGVFAATTFSVMTTLTVKVTPGFVVANVSGNVAAAIATYIDALPLGSPLPYTMVAALAYGVPGVASVSNITLNSATADIVPTVQQTLKCANVAVSAS